MAISFAQSRGSTTNWCQAEGGTGRALVSALDVLAKQTGNQNLKTAPLTIVGVCAAGQFSYHFAAFAPERVRAFMTIGGGKHDLSKVGATALVPALIVVTPDRPAYATSNLNALYAAGVAHGAPWQKASEPISNYDAGKYSSEGLSFIESSMENTLGSAKIKSPGAQEGSGNTFLPVSICGRKLPKLADVESSSITLNKIDLLSHMNPIFSVHIHPLQNAAFDDIFVQIRDSILSTKIRKIGGNDWEVVGSLDQSKIPIGPSTYDVPFRFLKGGKQILGGVDAIVKCVARGEVASVPEMLNMGTVEPGNSLSFPLHLIPRVAGAIRVGEIQSSFPWVQMTSYSRSADILCLCTIKPPQELQGQRFAGYIEVRLERPTNRFLRIFYFGMVDKGISDIKRSSDGSQE
jgi:hypothetical protein